MWSESHYALLTFRGFWFAEGIEEGEGGRAGGGQGSRTEEQVGKDRSRVR